MPTHIFECDCGQVHRITITSKAKEDLAKHKQKRLDLFTDAFETVWCCFAELHHTANAGSKEDAAKEWAAIVKGKPDPQKVADHVCECMRSDDFRIGKKQDSREFAAVLPQLHKYLRERRYRSSIPFLRMQERAKPKAEEGAA